MYALIEGAAYMPHGYCLFWQPWLVTLFDGSDLLIFLAYSAIPMALLISCAAGRMSAIASLSRFSPPSSCSAG